MTSYLKLYQDFLQKKDSDVKRRLSNTQSLPEEEEVIEEEQTTTMEETVVTIANSAQLHLPQQPTLPLATKKMEQTYIRENPNRPATSSDPSNGLTPARTILVRRAPQCPSCHVHPLDEQELCDANEVMVPSYNEIQAKESMNECGRIAKYVKNFNPDDDDWESRINQIGWAPPQKAFFDKVVRILNEDQLGRLANAGRQHEAIQRRAIVDKSAARLRKLFALISWDSRLTQWLHCIFIEYLPSTYMASYLDMLQTLKSKVPLLIDKMLFGRPLNVSQELLAPVMKKKWEIQVNEKIHKVPLNAVVVTIPFLPISGPVPKRIQSWYEHLACIGKIVQVTLPFINNYTNDLPLEQLAEQIVSLARVKIQELRNENPSRSIILVGFNAGASLALQVAMTEVVACIVCMGFSFNTINGARGSPDDRVLDIKSPILFVIGQHSARTSQEEIESLRERMHSKTSLVIVGGADDALRVPNKWRQSENVTQGMVDLMVGDEVYEYVKKTLSNPPGPRVPTGIGHLSGHYKAVKSSTLAGDLALKGLNNNTGNNSNIQRKRKSDGTGFEMGETMTPAKARYTATIGRPRTRNLPTATGPTTGSVTTAGKPKVVSPSSGFATLSHKNSQNLSADGLSNDELSRTMQSLLNDTEQSSVTSPSKSLNPTADTSELPIAPKILTNYELVTPSKSTPIQTTFINSFQKPTIIGATTPANSLNTNLKMIPSNHFAQLKPASNLQSQSKIYTIKTTPTTLSGIVRNVPQNTVSGGQPQQIFAFKSANGGTQKYTVVKNTSAGLQFATPKSSSGSIQVASCSTAHSDRIGSQMDLSNIDDMPILFADNDGNLSEATASAIMHEDHKKKTNVGKLIISQKIIKEATVPASSSSSSSSLASLASSTSTANLTSIGTIPAAKNGQFYINKTNNTIIQTSGNSIGTIVGSCITSTPNNPNKLVYINRMKPATTNVLANSQVGSSIPKYAKVLVSNPKISTPTVITNSNIQITSISADAAATSGIVSAAGMKQVNFQSLKPVVQRPITGTVIGAGTSSSTAPGNIINLGNKTQFQILNSGSGVGVGIGGGTTTTTTNTSNLSDKPIIRNIVVKPGSLKQIPPHLTSQLINRNLTVRKVNIVPAGSLSGVAIGSTIPTSAISIVQQQSQSQDKLSGVGGGIDILTTSSTTEYLSLTNSTVVGSLAQQSSIQTAPKVITLNPINPSKTE